MPRATLVRTLVPVYLVLIAGLPCALFTWTLARVPLPWRAAASLAGILFACAMYVVVAGILSRFTLDAIIPGKFPRELGHAVYGPRRLYGLCWTAIYYCQPVYHAVLAVPLLKRLTFRLFGYRGSLDFQAYPDTWIRDLPLLTLGKGVYLSNKATISPNMCLRNGKIIVLPISIGEGTMVGHLTMIAPGVTIGENSEIGVGAALGLKATIGARTLVDHETIVDHDASIGSRCVIGTRSYIGRGATIADGLKIPPATVIPPRSVIRNQADIESLHQADVHRRRVTT